MNDVCDRRCHQCEPVVQPQFFKTQPRHIRAHHVQRTMGKVDDAQQTKNDRQTQAQHGVKRAIDQAQQELSRKGLNRNAKDFHGC